jgi:N-acyl homoserine lactone hydrolase
MLCGCASVALNPDRPELAGAPAKLPVGVEMTVVPLKLGVQAAPRCVAAGQASCLGFSEVVYVAYLVKHPHATFLIDASLAAGTPADVARLPWREWLAFNYWPEGSLGSALAAAGVSAPDFVILTHAHWDHAAGLTELSHPKVFVGPGELGFIHQPAARYPTVMSHQFDGADVTEVAWDGPAFEGFPASHDWFGDGSVVLVPLPGHTPGSIGIFLATVRGKRLFFIGDAAWSMQAVELPSHKLGVVSGIVDSDRAQLSDTLWRLHHLHDREPELRGGEGVGKVMGVSWQLSIDPARLQLERIHGWLAGSYWSPNIRVEVVEQAFRNSLSIGAYDAQGPQIGVARAVTDCATFAWLCDVFVDETRRGQGVAKAMVKALMADPRLTTLRRWCLATRDAHPLYRSLGFSDVVPGRWMEYMLPSEVWQGRS